MLKLFTPSSSKLLAMIAAAEAKCDADIEQTGLRKEAAEDAAMKETQKRMQYLGFKMTSKPRRVVQVWESHDGRFTVSAHTKQTGRPWMAYRGTEKLRAHGDMFFSGPVRTFGSAESAAKAALKAWRND